MTILSYDEVPSIKKRHPDQKIVFCSGSFDLTHLGHIRFFEACKKAGDVFVVAVGRDDQIRQIKGERRPILSEQVRLRTVDAIRWVDYAFLNPPTESAESLAPIREMLIAVAPDVWAVNHDASQMDFRAALAEELGITLRVFDLRRDDPEWNDLSTTGIINKIRDRS